MMIIAVVKTIYDAGIFTRDIMIDMEDKPDNNKKGMLNSEPALETSLQKINTLEAQLCVNTDMEKPPTKWR